MKVILVEIHGYFGGNSHSKFYWKSKYSHFLKKNLMSQIQLIYRQSDLNFSDRINQKTLYINLG